MVRTVDLVAYCGLYCGDCFIHRGKIADLARDLRVELRRAKFERQAAELAKIPFFKELSGYGDCYRVLGAMVRFRCRSACRKGGGPPFCKMRRCCQKKGLTVAGGVPSSNLAGIPLFLNRSVVTPILRT